MFIPTILEDSQPSGLIPRKKNRTKSTSKQPEEGPSTKRKRSSRKGPQLSSALSRQPTVTTSQRLPLVIGSKYLKIENIDLNELLVTPSIYTQTFLKIANFLI
jgi:hypothetical protein